MARTVIGLFDSFGDAERAVREMEEIGVPGSAISIITNRVNGGSDEYQGAQGTPEVSSAARGAELGAGIGGAGGILLGLGSIAIPGLGPLAAAGWLVAGLAGAGAGAATGAAAGGIIAALTGTGVPQEHAGYFAEGLRRGGSLVAIHTDGDLVEQAIRIMNRNGAVDINQRAEVWKQSGFTRFDPDLEPLTVQQLAQERERVRTMAANALPIVRDAGTANTTTLDRPAEAERAHVARDVDNEMALPIVEEELRVGKREVERGVRVYTRVIEEPVEENVQLREERVSIDRRPVDRPVEEADFAAFQEGMFEVRAIKEEPIIEKQARVVEEVVINRETTHRTETIRDTVRRTRVEVEPLETDVPLQDTPNPTADVRESETNLNA